MRTAIIGGDKRMLYAAQAFREAGAEVILSGFDTITERSVDPVLCADIADCIILPLRPVEGGCITAPYAGRPIPIRDLSEAIGEKPVFTGCADSVRGFLNGRIYDYTDREDFLIYNAALTAEGLLDVIGREYEGSVFRSRILILGYGRVGRIAARYLAALGAYVSAAARRSDTRAWAELDGIKAFDYSELELKSYDIIVNTVPAPVLDATAIDRVNAHAMIVDLASKPGGVDFDYARQRGVRAVHELGLPGKIAPMTAGRIIKDTICTIIKEENGGKDHVGLCDDGLVLHL